MVRENFLQRLFEIVTSAVTYGGWFGVIGTVLGLLGGALGGGIYEYTTGTSGGNGPLLFLLTAPIGGLLGIIYGIWRETGW